MLTGVLYVAAKASRNFLAASSLPPNPAARTAPWLARLRQMAAPMPRVPPVTNATRLLSLSPTRALMLSSWMVSVVVIVMDTSLASR
jgi:hypothetical protein